ncbi:g2158 [Coccomyxa viridis]|uniref:G2158 protein n=1 Tax=Coccomyxa viridis TaxID=1274662 RepID=A0ABP1FJQ6_9CHLO
MADAIAASNLVKEELPNDHDKPETHLMLFINGLNGNAGNWDVLIDQLGQYASANEVAILVSTANMSMKTYQGVDKCGERLAKEVSAYVEQHPALQRISVLGHSMGGLIARYALGKMYDPKTGLICGLRPAHFITLATPHLGCAGAVDSPAQVPLLQVAKIGGKPVQRVVAAAAKPFASMFLGSSGAQFFLHDSTDAQQPLLVRMTQDIPGDGYYFSAMKAFVTRTTYANIRGDQMVGWANSSLRLPKDLPDASNVKGKGVVMETPLEDALHPSDRLPVKRDSAAGRGGASITASTGSASMPGSNSGGALGFMPASPLEGGSGTRHMSSGSLTAVDKAEKSTEPKTQPPPASVSQTGELPQEIKEEEEEFEGSEATMEMLQTLQKLPWRRIDADFSATSMPFFAHNLIQVTRKWLNWEGVASVQHIAALIEEMEEDPRVQHALAAKAK